MHGFAKLMNEVLWFFSQYGMLCGYESQLLGASDDVCLPTIASFHFFFVLFPFWKPYLVSNAFTLSSLSCESRGNQIGLSFKTLFDVSLASEYESSRCLKGST